MSQLYYKILTGIVWAGKVRGIVRVEKREGNRLE